MKFFWNKTKKNKEIIIHKLPIQKTREFFDLLQAAREKPCNVVLKYKLWQFTYKAIKKPANCVDLFQIKIIGFTKVEIHQTKK